MKSMQSFFQSLVLLLIRLPLGVMFLQSGYGKLHHLDKTIEYFNSLHIPMANFQAPFIGGLECIGGLALILGFQAKFFAFLLSCTMIVATLTAKREDIQGLGSLIEISEILYALLLLALTAFGEGTISISRLKRRAML